MAEKQCCDACLDPMPQGAPYSYDSVNSMTLCEACTPSYADMLTDPGSFYDADEEYMTPEQARATVDAHIAAGGKLTDKVGLHRPE